MANILYQKLERQYSIDNGNTWITMDAYKVGDILENPSDCGGESSGSTSGGTESSGSTTECTDTLSFAWSGSSSSQTFKINNTTYTAKTNPYVTTLSDLNVSSFTSAQYMFSSCANITAITSIPCTNNVTDMIYMFDRCTSLTSLDLSSFDTSNVTNMEYMFRKCGSLTTIKVTNCSSDTISKLQEALTSDGFTSTVSNGIITVNH